MTAIDQQPDTGTERMLRAMLIDVAAKEVSAITLPETAAALPAAIQRCIGCKVLALGAVLPNNDVLYVNQLGVMECERYFKHSLARVPIPDNAIPLGRVSRTGESCAAHSTLAMTRASVQFMDRWAALEWALATQERVRDQVA